MSKSQMLRIPPEAKRVLDAAGILLDRRRSDDLVDAEKAATERAVSAEAERAGQSLERIEVDLAVADADGNEAAHRQLTASRTTASETAAKAREALAAAQRTRRGVANRRAVLEDEIAASEHAVAGAIHEIRQAVLVYWREKLHGALTGTIPGGLVTVLREGWATAAAIGVPNRDLLEIKVRDPLRFAEGFGTRMLIDGHRNFAGSADGRTAEDLSISWRADPALKALHNSPVTLPDGRAGGARCCRQSAGPRRDRAPGQAASAATVSGAATRAIRRRAGGNVGGGISGALCRRRAARTSRSQISAEYGGSPLPREWPMSAAPPPSDTLTIKTGGKILGGWLSARIERGIERLPSSYVIEITEFYPGQSGVAVVQPGAPAQVYAGSDLLLTGWIDVYSPRYEAEQHQVRIEGRSLCEDLVDCSIVPPVPGLGPTGWQFSGGSIGQWAEVICAPFKIPVSLPQGDFKLDANQVFTINPGETAYQLLQTMSRNAMVLLYDDPQGRLVISQAGTVRAGSPLVEGVNAEKPQCTWSTARLRTAAAARRGPSCRGCSAGSPIYSERRSTSAH